MIKQEKIRQLLAMQNKFIKQEREKGVSMKDYLVPEKGSVFEGYQENSIKIAMEIAAQAHKEVGSKS